MSNTIKSIMKFSPKEQLFGHKSESQMLIWMKPLEFLDKTPERNPEYWKSPSTSMHLDMLGSKMKKDVPIDPLFLDINIESCEVINHEGRHRAMAAEKIGIERVPVIIYLRGNHRKYVSVNEYLEQGCKCNYLNAHKQK
jgi:hypothetical protein